MISFGRAEKKDEEHVALVNTIYFPTVYYWTMLAPFDRYHANALLLNVFMPNTTQVFSHGTRSERNVSLR